MRSSSLLFYLMDMLGTVTRVPEKIADKHLIHNRAEFRRRIIASMGEPDGGMPQEVRAEHAPRFLTEHAQEVIVNHAPRFLAEQSRMKALLYGREMPLLSALLVKKDENGKRILTAAFNTCEIMAVMNCLVNLGLEKDARIFPELLHRFERRGIVLWGYFGTSPRAMSEYLKSRNVEIRLVDCKKSRLDDCKRSRLVDCKKISDSTVSESTGSTGSTYLLFATVGKGVFSGIHTMCIIKKPEGWQVLNDFMGNKTYTGLAEAIAASCREGRVLSLWELCDTNHMGEVLNNGKK